MTDVLGLLWLRFGDWAEDEVAPGAPKAPPGGRPGVKVRGKDRGADSPMNHQA